MRVVLCMAGLFLGCGPVGAAESNWLAWAEEVLLGTEYNRRDLVCSRWDHSPTVAVVGGDPARRRLVEEALAEVNRALQPVGLHLRPVPERGEITVFLAPTAQFPELARLHHFQWVPGNDGYFFLAWDGGFVLRRAFILLSSDRYTLPELAHAALEELTQCLGLPNDSRRVRESIFFADGEDGGDLLRLSAADLRLIRFLYRRLRPGDGPAELRRAWAEEWAEAAGHHPALPQD